MNPPKYTHKQNSPTPHCSYFMWHTVLWTIIGSFASNQANISTIVVLGVVSSERTPTPTVHVSWYLHRDCIINNFTKVTETRSKILFSKIQYLHSGERETGRRLNIETVFPGMLIRIIKIKWAYDRLILIMSFPIWVKRHIFAFLTKWSIHHT